MQPDIGWREQVITQMQNWLKIPFTIASHKVAMRPTTAGQFPLMGKLPYKNNVYLFGGLGTRGFTLAPVLSAPFSEYLCGKSEYIGGYNEEKFYSFF